MGVGDAVARPASPQPWGLPLKSTLLAVRRGAGASGFPRCSGSKRSFGLVSFLVAFACHSGHNRFQTPSLHVGIWVTFQMCKCGGNCARLGLPPALLCTDLPQRPPRVLSAPWKALPPGGPRRDSHPPPGLGSLRTSLCHPQVPAGAQGLAGPVSLALLEFSRSVQLWDPELCNRSGWPGCQCGHLSLCDDLILLSSSSGGGGMR